MAQSLVRVPPPLWYSEVPRNTHSHVVAGVLVIASIICGFGLWAATAPIAGAIVASGAFVATGQNKVVQHLEGGIIKSILVHEGDIVEEGQDLIILDDTAPKADLRRLQLKMMRLQAIEARLMGEINEQNSIPFPKDLLEHQTDVEIRSITSNQQLTFEAHRRSLQSDITSQMQAIASLREHVGGARTQLSSVERQTALIDEELASKELLYKQGMIRKSEYLALQRSRAALDGENGRLSADIGDTNERIARTFEQINGLRNTAIKSAVEQLQDTRAELFDTRERLLSARNIVSRLKIAAPVKGIVVTLGYHTAGGVVEPGKAVMEILPLDAELIIEVKIRPQDIDHVKQNSEAMVRLSALSQRVTPMVPAEVIYLSADAVAAQQGQSGENYIARVRLNPESIPDLQNFHPVPGMPAEVYIKTSERTFLSYLLRPLKDSMSRAFREN